MRISILGWFIALFALAPLAGAAIPSPHVKAQLLADVKQIIPGKPFQLGVLMTIDPGWHIYWLNPGDSGQATKIKLQLPKGFTAGDVQFPTPIKIVDPGNINVFGYTNEVMFIATVTPDAKLPLGDADLSAKVNYLVCKDDCIPGKATPELKLPIGAAGTSEAPANEKLFNGWLEQLPVAPEKVNLQQTNLLNQTIRLRFDIGLFGGKPEVFPGPNDDVEMTAKITEQRGPLAGAGAPNWVEVDLQIKPLAGRAMPKVQLPVVIGWNAGTARRGVLVEIDLAKLKSAGENPSHT